MKKNIYDVVRNIICILILIILISTLMIIRIKTDSQAEQVIISEDTIWSIADSPYFIAGNVLVEQGSRLTIEPGVEVKFEGYYYIQIEGKLVAEGTENKMIIFTSSKSSPESGDWQGIKLMNNANNGTIFKYCKIEYAILAIFVNEMDVSKAPNITFCEINDNTENGILYYTTSDSIYSDPILKEISNNTFTDNGNFGIDLHFSGYYNSSLFVNNNVIKNNNGGGINIFSSEGNLTISHNIIKRNEGSGIYCEQGENVYINNNLILFNNGNGIVLEHDFFLLIEQNTIMNNSNPSDLRGGGLLLKPYKEEANTIIRYNNIYNNSPNDAGNGREFDRDISYNWWGTTDTGFIEERIYDFYDDFNKGKLNYTPYLVEPDTDAPDSSEYFKEPPIIPTRPIGTVSGIINVSYKYSSYATEPNNEQLRYGWDWNGNGLVDEWSNYTDSGSFDNRSHSWSESGNYSIKVKVIDEFGAESAWSNILTVTISIPPNESPKVPTQLSGQETGETNTSYIYSISATDSDGNRIKYGWDWDGDEVVDEWSDLLDSGTTDTRSHNWSTKGTYNVKVKAKDEYGGESDWSDVFLVTISEDLDDSDTNRDNDLIIPTFLLIIIIIVIILLIFLYLRRKS